MRASGSTQTYLSQPVHLPVVADSDNPFRSDVWVLRRWAGRVVDHNGRVSALYNMYRNVVYPSERKYFRFSTPNRGLLDCEAVLPKSCRTHEAICLFRGQEGQEVVRVS